MVTLAAVVVVVVVTLVDGSLNASGVHSWHLLISNQGSELANI